MSPPARRWFVVAVPVLTALLLTLHPLPEGDRLYAELRDDVTRWQVVHVGMLPMIGLLAVVMWLLLAGVRGRAATVSRAALVPFLVAWVAWESNIGIASGVLIDQAQDLPAGDQRVAAEMIQEHGESALVGNVSVIGSIANLSWVVVAIAAAVAVRHAGAGRLVTALIGLSALFALHPPPVGPVGLLCLAAGALLWERDRARLVERPAPGPRLPGVDEPAAAGRR